MGGETGCAHGRGHIKPIAPANKAAIITQIKVLCSCLSRINDAAFLMVPHHRHCYQRTS
jgi:hypothetical protein